MVPPNFTLCSIIRKESPESQQKHTHGNKFLRTLWCLNDNLNTGHNQKTPIRKSTSIIDGVCFNYEQLFHPVQCTVCRICQGSTLEKLVLPKTTGILRISDQIHHP